MLISLHKQATTTPKVRAAIQQSDEPAWILADRFGTTEQTIYKWRHRDSVQDRFGVRGVVLLALDEGFNIRWRDQPHIMTQFAYLAAPEMSTPASFHRNDARL